MKPLKNHGCQELSDNSTQRRKDAKKRKEGYRTSLRFFAPLRLCVELSLRSRNPKSLLLCLLSSLCLCITTFVQGESEWKGSTPGGFEATISLADDHITIPTPIRLTAVLQYPSEYAPDFPAMRKHLTQPLNLLLPDYKLTKEEISQPKVLHDGLSSQTVSYTLEPLTLGEISLSLLDIPFVSKGKGPHTLFSGILTVEVVKSPQPSDTPSALGFPAPLLPLTPGLPISLTLSNREKLINNPVLLAQEAIRNERIFSQHSFPWLGVILVLGLLLIWAGWKQLMAYLAWKKSIAAGVNPQQRALIDMALLRIDQAQEFYLRLTDIVRTYVEKVFGIRIQEETTEEFLSMVQQHPSFTSEMKSLIAPFLRTGDLVKFAHYRPSQQECEAALEAARAIIGRQETGDGRQEMEDRS